MRVARFRQASLKGWAYAMAHTDELVDLIIEKYNTQNKSREHLQYEAQKMVELVQPLLVEIGYMHQTRWEHIQDTFQRLGFISQDFDLDTLTYNPNLPHQQRQVTLSNSEQQWIREHPEIRMGVDPEWLPIEYVDSEGVHNGISADLTQLLNKTLGLTMRAVPGLSWKEVMMQAVAQQIDLLPAVASTEERRKFLNFSTPYMHIRWAIVSLADHPDISGLTALEGVKIAVTQGYASHNRLTHDWQEIPLLPKGTVLETLQAVIQGETEAAIIDLDTATPLIQAHSMTQLKIDTHVFDKKDALSIAVRKDWPELLSIINKGLAAIGAEEIQRIQLKWMAVPVQVGMQRGEVALLVLIIAGGLGSVVALFLFWNRRLAHEVSARKQSEAHLRVAKEHAEQAEIEASRANLAKDEFLASMSHELRTPLTSIIGNSEFLAENEIDPKRKGLIRAIEIAGRGQLALVSDILDMLKIGSGKFTLDEAPYDLSVLLGDIQQMLSPSADSAGLEFVVTQKGSDAYLLMGDGQRIEQILINLVGNAIKFTVSGKVSLSCWVNGRHLIFQIKDSGIGMSPDILEHLFQRFEQADSSISRRFGGSGLGLFISKNLADLMGGMIDVSSQEGVGSIFELILPYRPSDIQLEPAEPDNTTPANLHQKISGHVLIAEDTLELQLLERRILEGMGATVTTAQNGQEAVNIATAHPQRFDLILMDIQMPEMDGIEATKLLRVSDHSTPIVALTANVMQKHRDAFHQAGGDGFLVKPIDKHALRQILLKYLKQEQIAAAPADEPIDDALMATFIKSNIRNREELLRALSARDWEKVRELAQTVKGSGASFGYPQLTQLGEQVCYAIEENNPKQAAKLATDLVIEISKALP
ncbi:MAG: transporter substrate-binding domain-containing protein [Gammaproteobacteria bacterium]|nr:transporter substrate-binding domain-containing protein [Gammaproteobacteria bacterium]